MTAGGGEYSDRIRKATSMTLFTVLKLAGVGLVIVLAMLIKNRFDKASERARSDAARRVRRSGK